MRDGFDGAFEGRRRWGVISGFDNAETLAWLDESLAFARDGGPSGVEALLEAVRVEVLFEIELYGPPSPNGEVAT